MRYCLSGENKSGSSHKISVAFFVFRPKQQFIETHLIKVVEQMINFNSFSLKDNHFISLGSVYVTGERDGSCCGALRPSL